MLRLQNVSVTLNGKKILKNISCSIEKNDFIVIVGPNGAGKSTFFDILSGKMLPTSGSIFFNNSDITHLSEQERTRFISRLFQNPQLNGSATMTVAQNLAMSAYKGKNIGLQNGMARFPHNLSDDLRNTHLDSEKILNSRMKDLSGGQRQLLAFLMAVSTTPELFLLDEPTAALDPSAATKLLQFCLKWITEHHMTTLLITHDPELALTIGKKIWILENGTITKQFVNDGTTPLSAADLIGHIDYELLKNKQ